MSTTLAQAKEALCRVVANGVAPADPRVVTRVNEATQRLFSLTDFVGKKVRYGFDAQWGCVTLPRHLETVLGANVNGCYFHIRNGWFEYLEGGPGVLTAKSCTIQGIVDRGDGHPTYHDICGAHHIKIYADLPEAAGATILIKGFDENNNEVMTQVDGKWILGEYVAIDNASPGVSTKQFSRITQIVKPKTNGYVRVYQYDPPTILPELLLVEPTEDDPNFVVLATSVTAGTPGAYANFAYSISITYNSGLSRFEVSAQLTCDTGVATLGFNSVTRPTSLTFSMAGLLGITTGSIQIAVPAGSGPHGTGTYDGDVAIWYQPAHTGTLGYDRQKTWFTNDETLPDPFEGDFPAFTGQWLSPARNVRWFMRSRGFFEVDADDNSVLKVLVTLYADQAHLTAENPFYSTVVIPGQGGSAPIVNFVEVTDPASNKLSWAFRLSIWREPIPLPGDADPIFVIDRAFKAAVPGTVEQSGIGLLHPDEEVPSLRRYLIPGIDGAETAKVSLLCQRRWVEVSRDSDLVYPGNLGALKHMLLAIEKEEKNKLQEAQAHEATARRILRDELKQFLGPHSQPLNMQVSGHFQPFSNMM